MAIPLVEKMTEEKENTYAWMQIYKSSGADTRYLENPMVMLLD